MDRLFTLKLAAFAAFFGGTVAWTMTTQFSIPYFVLTLLGVLALHYAALLLKPVLAWPLLLFWGWVGFLVQARQLSFVFLWPWLLLGLFWGMLACLVSCPEKKNLLRAFYPLAYGGLLLGVALGGLPFWAVLTLLPLPLAWRVWRAERDGSLPPQDLRELITQVSVTSSLFLTVAYLIKGLVR